MFNTKPIKSIKWENPLNGVNTRFIQSKSIHIENSTLKLNAFNLNRNKLIVNSMIYVARRVLRFLKLRIDLNR